MAKRALDAHRLDATLRRREGGDANHGVELEQRDRGSGVVEVHLAGGELLLERRRQRVGIDLQADREGGLGRDAGTDAAVLLARDCLMQLQRIAPERFAAECVITKYF